MNAPAESFITANRRPATIRRQLKALRSVLRLSRLEIGRIQVRHVMRLIAVGDEETAQAVKAIFEEASARIDRCVIDQHNSVTDAWARSAKASQARGLH